MLPMTQNDKFARVVVVGAGFAGLNAAKALANAAVQVTVLDRKNHHTFQPLLYQVALAALSPAEIASPIRNVLRGAKNTEVLLGEVSAFDLERRVVTTHAAGDSDALEIPYDYLILAAGATHAYFGHAEWEQYAPGLKTIEDATEIRGRVLLAFEHAEREAFAHNVTPQLNFVVVGAGPTGVELAGAISDISREYLQKDFRTIDPSKSRIILIEGGPRVLAAYPPDLSASAQKQLEEMGVEVRTGAMVTNIELGMVTVGKEKIAAAVILWGAGVSASPLGRMLGVPVDRAGRVLVEQDLTIPGHPEVFIIGDLAAAEEPGETAQSRPGATVSDEDKHTKYVPGVAPAAIQMGKFAARQIRRSVNGEAREVFRYRDKGSLATIGRSHAVGDLGRFHISGYFAWLAWLFIHLFFLIGFRNRIMVMMEWAWAYISFNRSARLITEPKESVMEEERPVARVG